MGSHVGSDTLGHIIDIGVETWHTYISYMKHMTGVQLTPQLRYLGLNDEGGDFGLLIVHTDEHVHYTIQIETKEELRAAVESFQKNPVGTLVWCEL